LVDGLIPRLLTLACAGVLAVCGPAGGTDSVAGQAQGSFAGDLSQDGAIQQIALARRTAPLGRRVLTRNLIDGKHQGAEEDPTASSGCSPSAGSSKAPVL